MSGTGKSTLILELNLHAYKAVGMDNDEWSEWANNGDEPDWVWRVDRIQRLPATEDADVLFISGCKSNLGAFYP